VTIIRGGPAGPDGSGGAYLNEVETDRSAWWHALGGRQGVLKGFVHSGVAGAMALDFTAGAALVGERAADGTASLDRGYLVWADATTRVTFGPASASARNDAVVAAFVDVEDGPVGTGGLEVGPHLVVVPGVSGTTTPRADADINAYLGRGGWVRLMDVPVAAGSTEINVANIDAADARIPANNTGLIAAASGQIQLSDGGSAPSSVAVTFPPGRFTSPPSVGLTHGTGAAKTTTSNIWVTPSPGVTVDGFTAVIARSTTTTVNVTWTAIQTEA
jgi:hypothetical protein